jgi:hypothetical protein
LGKINRAITAWLLTGSKFANAAMRNRTGIALGVPFHAVRTSRTHLPGWMEGWPCARLSGTGKAICRAKANKSR